MGEVTGASIISTLTDRHIPRRYPRLTPAQKDHMLREVALYFAAMDWIRSGHQARTFAYRGEQLDLFAHSAEPI
jgi:hypothetical protein